MTVARDNLRRHDVHLQAQLGTDVLLHLRVDGGVGSDRAADASDRGVVGRVPQPVHRAVELRHPTGDLEAERDRFRDDAVGPAGHQRAAVTDRKVGRGLAQFRKLVTDELRRLDHLDGHRRVIEVLAGHAEVHVARFGLPDRLVENGEERDHVVADARLDLGDLRGLESALADLRQGGFGDAAKRRPRFASQDLDPQPELKLVLLRPDRSHGGRRVSLDQEGIPISKGRRGHYIGHRRIKILLPRDDQPQDLVANRAGRWN